MKMSFPLGGTAQALAAPIDYRTLVAGIVGRQSASRTAAVAARLVPAAPAVAMVEALAGTLLVERGHGAAAMLKGSFNPATAMRFGKAGSTNMKPAFTFAFQRSFNADDIMSEHAGGPKLGETACSRCQ